VSVDVQGQHWCEWNLGVESDDGDDTVVSVVFVVVVIVVVVVVVVIVVVVVVAVLIVVYSSFVVKKKEQASAMTKSSRQRHTYGLGGGGITCLAPPILLDTAFVCRCSCHCCCHPLLIVVTSGHIVTYVAFVSLRVTCE
jgi:hypothetical protein